MREVLAETAVDGAADRLEVLLDDRLHHRLARAAGRPGPRARGDAGGAVAAAALGDRVLDLLLGDVVARADLRLVRQLQAPVDPPLPSRKDQLLGVGRQRDPRVGRGGHHRPQHAVRRRVADQDAAEQPGAVLGDDQLLVDAGHRVGEDQLERALGGRERVAERRHVDAEQLELRRHVRAAEGARTAEDRVDHHLGHRVAGRDQAVHPAGRGRALADRPDVRVRGPAPLVDQHAAALGELQSGGAGQRVAGADAGGEDHQVQVEGLGVPQGQSGDPAVAEDPLGHRAGVHGQPERLDVPGQRRAAGVVDLDGHQPRRHLHDVRVQAQAAQGVGGLEAEQPAADHRAGAGAQRGGADRVEVLDGPVDEAAGQLVARHRRHERRRAGRQHELVVRQHALPTLGVFDEHGPGRGVEPLDLPAEQQPDPRVVVLPFGQQRERVRADLEVRRQRDPVVRRARLLADHHHVVGLGQAALDRGLDEPVRDHAVADDDQGPAEVGAHAGVPSSGADVSATRCADGVGAPAAAGGGAGGACGRPPARCSAGSARR